MNNFNYCKTCDSFLTWSTDVNCGILQLNKCEVSYFLPAVISGTLYCLILNIFQTR